MIEMQNKLEKIEQTNEYERWPHGNDGRFNVAKLFVLFIELININNTESCAFHDHLKLLFITNLALSITLAISWRWSQCNS